MSGSEASGVTSGGGQTAYPVQRHAGKVGYGPNYHAGASFSDRVEGLYEEMKGHLTHNPDLIHHGHELFTGEQKRRQLLGEDSKDPVFEKGHQDAKKRGGTGPTSSTSSKPPEPGSASVVSRKGKEPAPLDASENAKLPAPEGAASRHMKSL